MIDFFGRQEDLQIAEEVADDEAEEHQARDGDDPFSPDGRGGEAEEGIHKEGKGKKNARLQGGKNCSNISQSHFRTNPF